MSQNNLIANAIQRTEKSLKRVLVTGASGFIGSHIAKRAAEAGYDVRGVVLPGDDTSFLSSLGVEVLLGDLTDPNIARKAAKDRDVIFNAVGRAGDYGSFDDFNLPNFVCTENILNAAIECGVQRIVHASSYVVTMGGSFHYWKGGLLAEQTPETQRYWRWDYYAQTKVAAEKVILNAHAQGLIEAVPLRIGWVYGERDRTSFPRLVDIIRSGNGIIIGNGLNHLCLVYATDVADAFLLAGNPSIPAGKPYTIGGVADKNPITQKEYMNSIAQLIGAPAPRIYLPFKVAIALSTAMESTWHFLRIRKPPLITSFAVHLLGRDQVFDTSFAQRSLGWAPQVSFADGMRETLACLDQEYKNSAKE